MYLTKLAVREVRSFDEIKLYSTIQPRHICWLGATPQLEEALAHNPD